MIEKELLWVHALDEVFSSTGRIGCSRCFEEHYVYFNRKDAAPIVLCRVYFRGGGVLLDILCALNELLRMVKEIDKLSMRCLSSWTMHAATLSKIEEKKGELTYQKQTFKNYASAKDI